MVLDCAFGDRGDSVVYFHWRRGGHASVELAATAALRLENTWILASSGIAGAMPNSLRPSRRTWGTRSGSPLERSLQEDDTGGAGKIPAGDGRGFRHWTIGWREGNVVNSRTRNQPEADVRRKCYQ